MDVVSLISSEYAIKTITLGLGIAILYIIYRLVLSRLEKTLRVKSVKKSVIYSSRKFVRIIFYIIAFMLIVATYGINPSDVLLNATIIAAALTLAASQLISDLLAGIYIAIAKPFELGDRVEIAGIYGDVVDIGLMSTKIRKWDRNVITLPSTMIMSEIVQNYDEDKTGFIANAKIPVSYSTDFEKAFRLMEDAVEISKKNCEYIIDDDSGDTPWVCFGDRDRWVVWLEVYFLVKNVRNRYDAEREVMKNIQKLFRDNGIKMGMQSLDLAKM